MQVKKGRMTSHETKPDSVSKRKADAFPASMGREYGDGSENLFGDVNSKTGLSSSEGANRTAQNHDCLVLNATRTPATDSTCRVARNANESG